MRSWLILLVMLVPLATAQVPSQYTLELSPDSATADASLEEAGTVTFTFSFESQNPLDAQSARTFHVDVDGAAAGWTLGATPSAFQMTAGGTQTIAITAQPGANAAKETTVTVTVTLIARGANPIPGVGEILDPEASTSSTATFNVESSATRTVLEALNSWIWFVLVGILVLLIIVGKFISDARRVYVALHADVTEVHLAPGKSVAVPLRVENLGPHEDTIVFHVAKVGGGWSAALPVPELDLDGGALESLQLIVAAPKDAKPGDRVTIGLSAHSGRAPRRVAEAIITAVVD